LKNLKYCQVTTTGALNWSEAGLPLKSSKEMILRCEEERHEPHRKTLSKLNERIKTLPGNTPRDLQMEVKGPKVWEEKLAMDKKVLKSYGWSGQQTKSKEGKQRQRKRYVSKAKKS